MICNAIHATRYAHPPCIETVLEPFIKGGEHPQNVVNLYLNNTRLNMRLKLKETGLRYHIEDIYEAMVREDR